MNRKKIKEAQTQTATYSLFQVRRKPDIMLYIKLSEGESLTEIINERKRKLEEYIYNKIGELGKITNANIITNDIFKSPFERKQMLMLTENNFCFNFKNYLSEIFYIFENGEKWKNVFFSLFYKIHQQKEKYIYLIEKYI